MSTLGEAVVQALRLVTGADPRLIGIVLLSLRVSLASVAIASAIGFPLGATIAVSRFPGRHTLVVVLNSLLGLPPVVVGLRVTAGVGLPVAVKLALAN